LSIAVSAKGIEVLRSLPKLKHLSFAGPPDNDWNRCSSAEEFWKAYDARKAAASTKRKP
jgi:hypothetical protein